MASALPPAAPSRGRRGKSAGGSTGSATTVAGTGAAAGAGAGATTLSKQPAASSSSMEMPRTLYLDANPDNGSDFPDVGGN
ncbi:hypothetical protein ACU4GD_16295 [Cupriavidus basilensis]